MKNILKLFLILIIASSISFASVPGQINYQGILKDSAGKLVTNPSLSITFSIYANQTTTTNLWTETQTVSVDAGVYSVQLGSGSGAEIGSSVFDGTTRYLGIKVGTDAEMTPRIILVTVPYAFRAATAEALGNYTAAKTGSGDFVPVTTSGKLDASVIPTSGVQADSSDMVDGFHASATATPNYLFPLDNYKRIALTGGDPEFIIKAINNDQYGKALWGETRMPDTVAVYGLASNETGQVTGIKGEVAGGNTNPASKGVFGAANAGTGVYGSSSVGNGVYGYSNSGAGVSGESLSGKGVYGKSAAQGVHGDSLGGQGVMGSSTNGQGVYGISTNGTGVYGYSSASGGIGIIGKGSKTGISAESAALSGYGGYFTAGGNGSIGIYANGLSLGVWGKSTSQDAGSGVGGLFTSDKGTGVQGISYDTSGLYTKGGFFETKGYNKCYAVVGKATHASGDMNYGGWFQALGPNATGVIGFAPAGASDIPSDSFENAGVRGETNIAAGYSGYFKGGRGMVITGSVVPQAVGTAEGTIRYNSPHFYGYVGGGGWKQLDN